MEKEKLRAIRGKLENRAIGMSARFFGVADLTEALEIIVEQGGDFLAAFPRSISLGIALNDSIVDQLYRHKEVGVARTYDYLYYTVNQSLDRIALHLSAILMRTVSRHCLSQLQIQLITKKFMGFFPTNYRQGLRDWVGLAQVVS